MHKKQIQGLGFLTGTMIVTLGGALLLGQGKRERPELNGTAVIAVVNGTPIPYSAIRLTPKEARNRFVSLHGRNPNAETDGREVGRIRQSYETKRLIDSTRVVIRKQQIDRLGVEVSQAEVQERVAELMAEKDPSVAIAEWRAKLMAIESALDAACNAPEKADAVYEAQLTDYVSREGWALYLANTCRPEQRRQFERLLAMKVDDFLNDTSAVEAGIRMLKVRQAIQDELAREPEFTEQLKSDGPMYLDAKIYEWWQQRYREAEIEIKSDRFKGVLEQLLK